MTFIFKTYPQKRRSQFHDHLFTKGKAGALGAGMCHRPRLGRVHECDPCHPGSAGVGMAARWAWDWTGGWLSGRSAPT